MSGCPVNTGQQSLSVSECPVQSSASSSNTNNSDKPKYNASTNDYVFGHEKQPGQTIDLKQSRAVSTIPKGEQTASLEHQPTMKGEEVKQVIFVRF